jgi:hypothetical protein
MFVNQSHGEGVVSLPGVFSGAVVILVFKQPWLWSFFTPGILGK